MDLGFLRGLYAQIGDYVSVYLDTDRVHEDAAEVVGIELKAASRRLAAAGASPASLDAVRHVIADRDAAAGRAVFARAGEVTLAGKLDAPPRRVNCARRPYPNA